MKKVIISLALIALASTAFAADIAKGPAVVEGTLTHYADTQNRGDAAVVNIIDATFTDVSAYYMTGLTNAGFTPDNYYDPMGDLDYSTYTAVIVSASDNWWAAASYPTEIPAWGAYMDAGGNLSLVGQDFIWGSADAAFVQNYFGMVSVVEDVGAGSAEMLTWTGADVLPGLTDAYIPCFGSNGWYTDDVVPTFSVCTWETTDVPGTFGGGSASADNVFSVVEFGCGTVDVVGLLVGWGSTPTEDVSISTIKALY